MVDIVYPIENIYTKLKVVHVKNPIFIARAMSVPIFRFRQ